MLSKKKMGTILKLNFGPFGCQFNLANGKPIVSERVKASAPGRMYEWQSKRREEALEYWIWF